MTRYCLNNVVCLNKLCIHPHYKSYDDRMILNQLYEMSKDEMDLYMEPIKIGKPTCRYHYLCFERECPYNHNGYTLESRKIIIKLFKTHNNRERAKKRIEADIEAIKKGESMNWADMCKC